MSEHAGMLSDRERTIAQRYATGETYREIAEALYIAPATVRNHLAAIYRKLGVKSKPGLIAVLAPNSAEGREPPAATMASFDKDPAAAQAASARDEISTPSVVVLPFEVMENVPDQQHLAYGITENIIAELTRFRELFVIDTRSAFAARSRFLSTEQLREELHVLHVVTGTIHRQGSRIRVTAHLADAQSGRQLWSENYDRELGDLFALQDDIAAIVVSTLAGRIEDAGRERATRKDENEMAAYDHVLRGRECLHGLSENGLIQAREHFKSALVMNSDLAPAYSGLARSHLWEYWSDWSRDPQSALSTAFELASRAVALDGSDHGAHKTLAMCYLHKRQYDSAIVHIDKCLTLNPNDYGGFCDKSWILAFTGRPAEGIECSREGIRRNPLSPAMCLMNAGIAHYTARQYKEAIRSFSETNTLPLWRLAGLAASYAQLDQLENACQASGELMAYAACELAVEPGEDPERWQTYWRRVFPFKHASDFDHLLAGLRKAGVPA